MAICSFKDEDVKCFFFDGKTPRKKGWAYVAKIAKRKLDMLHYAKDIQDLRSPPSNCLELLQGNLKGLYSIRINDQWRIIFHWDNGPCDVYIADYH